MDKPFSWSKPMYISYLGFMLHWPLPAGSFIERLTKQWTVGNVDNSCVWSNWIEALCFLTQVLLKLTANKAWCLDNVKLIIRLLLWMAFIIFSALYIYSANQNRNNTFSCPFWLICVFGVFVTIEFVFCFKVEAVNIKIVGFILPLFQHLPW